MLLRDELYFDIGSEERLHCSIQNKTNHARWVINGLKLEITNSSSRRIRAEDNGDLVIDDVQLSDGGVYECQILEHVQYYIVYINGMKTHFYLVEIGLTCRTMSCKTSTLLTFQKCSYDISAFHYSFQQQDLLRRRWSSKPLPRTRLTL